MACSWEQALPLEVFYNATIGECICRLINGFIMAVILIPSPGPLSAAASSTFGCNKLARRTGHCVRCYGLKVGKQVEAEAYEWRKLGSCTPVEGSNRPCTLTRDVELSLGVESTKPDHLSPSRKV